MENEKLTSFGNSFQSKIISSLLVKKTFLQTISDILQEEYFDSDANKWLVKNIISYFYEFKTFPFILRGKSHTVTGVVNRSQSVLKT